MVTNSFNPKFFLNFFIFLIFIIKPFSIKAQSDTNFIQIRNNFYQGYNGQVDPNEGSPLNLFKRAESMWGPRFGSSGSIINAGNAINNWVQTFNTGGRASSTITANWQPIGPFDKPAGTYTTGTGRLNCITFAPGYNGITNQTIYVGSPFGGVWKTIDDGLNWNNLNTDQLPIIKVSDIAINPTDANMIFIATGDRDDYGFTSQSAGVFRSLDGGLHWLPVNSGFSFSGFVQISKILINPSNVDEAYLTTSTGIYKTTNATSSCVWIQLSHTLVYNKHFRNLIYKPDNLYTTLFASGEDIIKSTNGGITWTSMTGAGTGLDFSTLTFIDENNITHNVPNPAKINIDVSPANPNYICASIISSDHAGQLQWNNLRAHFLYSYDGTTWQSKSSIPYGLVYVGDIIEDRIAIAVSPLNTDYIFVGNVITWRSLDGGNTALTPTITPPISPLSSWARTDYFSGIVHTDIHDIKYSPDGQSVFVASDGGFYKLTNPTYSSSPNWLTLNNGLAIGTITRIGLSKLEPDLMLIGEFDCGSNLYDPVNLGSTNPWKLTWAGDGAEQIIDYTNSNIMFSSAQSLILGRSADRGVSFSGVTNPLISTNPNVYESSEYYADYVIHPTNPNILYFNFTDLYKRTYIGNSGSWLKISNFRTDFAPINASYLSSVAISEKKPLFIYTSITAYDQSYNPTYRLFKTSTGGYDNGCTSNCWSEMFPPNPHYMTSIAISNYDENEIWVSYSGYNPNDKVKKFDGTSWIDYSNGLPNLPVNNLVFEKGSNDGIYAATDVGIYFRNASMTQWEAFIDNLPNVQVNELEINYASNKIRAGTCGRGLWESHLACPPTAGPLPLSGIQNLNKFEEAYGLITSTQTFAQGLNNTYRSTTEIDLLPGFVANATTGSSFDAYIHPCSTPGNSFHKPNVNNNSNSTTQDTPIAKTQPLVKNNIGITPNPNNGTFQITVTKNDAAIGVKDVKVYDMVGRVIWENNTPSGNTFTVDISNYAPGIYYVRALNEAGDIDLKKLIKE